LHERPDDRVSVNSLNRLALGFSYRMREQARKRLHRGDVALIGVAAARSFFGRVVDSMNERLVKHYIS